MKHLDLDTPAIQRTVTQIETLLAGLGVEIAKTFKEAMANPSNDQTHLSARLACLDLVKQTLALALSSDLTDLPEQLRTMTAAMVDTAVSIAAPLTLPEAMKANQPLKYKVPTKGK